MEFVNPCGGKRWRLLDGGLIEVEGEGIPNLQPSSAAYNQMLQVWQNWAPLLSSAAERHNVPVSWLLAIATMETGPWAKDPNAEARIVSYAGAIGIMQIMPATGVMFGKRPEQLVIPADNIDVGAALVAKLNSTTQGGLPAISARYNSGKLCSEGRNEWNLLADANYPRRVIEWNNTALLAGILGPSESFIAALGAAFGAMVALAALTRR